MFLNPTVPIKIMTIKLGGIIIISLPECYY